MILIKDPTNKFSSDIYTIIYYGPFSVGYYNLWVTIYNQIEDLLFRNISLQAESSTNEIKNVAFFSLK